MGGQANEGYLWRLSLGLDLLPPTICAGFSTLLLASLRKFGSKDPRKTILALDQV